MRVLVLENEQDTAELIRLGLESENYLVSIASDARKYQKRKSSEFDAIVLSLSLGESVIP